MSDFSRAFDEQVARERAEQERRAQLVARGRANVEAFVALMSERGIEPADFRTDLQADLLVQEVRRGSRPYADGGEPPSRGWSAARVDGNPDYSLSHYIREDGQVIDVTGHEPSFVSEDALADGEALAAHARAILASGNALHGDRGRH